MKTLKLSVAMLFTVAFLNVNAQTNNYKHPYGGINPKEYTANHQTNVELSSFTGNKNYKQQANAKIVVKSKQKKAVKSNNWNALNNPANYKTRR